jgi:plastocyanin/heme-degrading monooxygenase HmoA
MSDHGAAHGEGHGAHGGHGHGPEVWETSIWPVIAALSAIAASLALVWVARDSGNDFAGPVAGAALAATVLSVAAWVWERRQKAAEQAAGHDVDAPDPRYTQVLTFTIADGQLERARGDGGVLHEIESADLGAIEGFKDFRITLSPDQSGPSQVLVETTWADREGLAGYNASRQNLLDIVARHEAEVVPGTVQVFDMQVVRDTKHQSYRFGFGTALVMFGGLLAGGFLFGAAQTLFQEETVIADGGNGPIENPYEIEAGDNFFNKDRLVAPPNTEVTFTMHAVGVNPHNLAFFLSEGGELISDTARSEIITSGSVTVTFTTPGPGTYFFHCDIHPTTMKGVLEVREGAPPPGGGPGGPPAGGAVTVVATDNAFDHTKLEAKAGEEFTVTLKNDGRAQHTLTFLTAQGGTALADGADTGLVPSGESQTISFTVAEPGEYFYFCLVHPTEMTGTFVVQ